MFIGRIIRLFIFGIIPMFIVRIISLNVYRFIKINPLVFDCHYFSSNWNHCISSESFHWFSLQSLLLLPPAQLFVFGIILLIFIGILYLCSTSSSVVISRKNRSLLIGENNRLFLDGISHHFCCKIYPEWIESLRCIFLGLLGLLLAVITLFCIIFSRLDWIESLRCFRLFGLHSFLYQI